MSVLNRQANPSKKREKTDFYETKQHFANAHVNYIWKFMSPYVDENYRALDVGIGTGVYGKALGEIKKYTEENLDIYGIDITLERLPKDFSSPPIYDITIQEDFLTFYPYNGFDLIVGNPPYKDVIKFVEHGIKNLNRGGVSSFLLKASFLETKQRFEFFKQYRPFNIIMLANRPIENHAESYCIVNWQNDYFGGFDSCISTFVDWMYVTKTDYKGI